MTGADALRAQEYLMWQMAGPLLPLEERVRGALERFEEKWGKQPNVVLVSEHDAKGAAEVLGIPVRTLSYIRPGICWIGREGEVKA